MKKMALITSLFISIVLTFNAYGQVSNMVSNMKVSKEVWNSPTYFVMEDEDDERINIIQETWNITEAKVISQKKLQAISKNLKAKDCIFFVQVPKDENTVIISELGSDNLLLIGLLGSNYYKKSGSFVFGRLNILAGSLKLHFPNNESVNRASFKLYLQNLQNTLKVIKDNKVKCYVTGGMSKKLARYYSDKYDLIPKKELIVNENLFSHKYTKAQMKLKYPHKMRIVSNREWAKLVNEDNEDYLFWIKSSEGYSIIEGGTGHCYYWRLGKLKLSGAVRGLVAVIK